jgi:hypothetical protein
VRERTGGSACFKRTGGVHGAPGAGAERRDISGQPLGKEGGGGVSAARGERFGAELLSVALVNDWERRSRVGPPGAR